MCVPIKQRDEMTGLGLGGPGVGGGVCVRKNLVALYFFHMFYIARQDFMY